MKARKMWATKGLKSVTAIDYNQTNCPQHTVPVLVIDASEFPPDYPEIGSEWVGKITGATHKICGPPVYNGDFWFVASEGRAMMVRISDLKPIPQTDPGMDICVNCDEPRGLHPKGLACPTAVFVKRTRSATDDA